MENNMLLSHFFPIFAKAITCCNTFSHVRKTHYMFPNCFGMCTRRFHRFKPRALKKITFPPQKWSFLMFGSFKHVPHTFFYRFS